MQNNSVCACKCQDFAQSQKLFAWSHDRETVTFRNSAVLRNFALDESGFTISS